MTTSAVLIVDYLGEGTLAARPAAPAIPTGGIGFYYIMSGAGSGDTYLWDTNSAAWVLFVGGGAAGGTRSMIATGNTTGGTSSTTNPVNSLTVSGAGAASVGFTNGTMIVSAPAAATANSVVVAGNTAAQSSSSVVTLGSMSLSATGPLSIGMSAGTLVFSAAATAGAVTTNDYFALGNTTAATSSGTASNSAISISGAGAVSVGIDTTAAGANVWVISSPAVVASGTVQNWFALGNTTAATTSFANTLSIHSVSGGGVVSVGMDTNGVLNISATVGAAATVNDVTIVGNTTAQSSSSAVTLGQMSISAAGGLSAGMSAGTLVLSGASPGAAGTTISSYCPEAIYSSIGGAVTAGVVCFCPVDPPQPLAMNQIRMWALMLTSVAAAPGSSSAGTSFSLSMSQGFSYGLYSQIAAQSNQWTTYVTSSVAFSISQSGTGTSNSMSNFLSYTYPLNGTTVSTTFSTSAVGGANFPAFNASVFSLFSGSRRLDLPLATTLPAGNYLYAWMGSSRATVGTAVGFSVTSIADCAHLSTNYAAMNETRLEPWQNMGSIATAAWPISSLADSSIITIASHAAAYISLGNWST